jgi:hypothetical protein
MLNMHFYSTLPTTGDDVGYKRIKSLSELYDMKSPKKLENRTLQECASQR